MDGRVKREDKMALPLYVRIGGGGGDVVISPFFLFPRKEREIGGIAGWSAARQTNIQRQKERRVGGWMCRPRDWKEDMQSRDKQK